MADNKQEETKEQKDKETKEETKEVPQESRPESVGKEKGEEKVEEKKEESKPEVKEEKPKEEKKPEKKPEPSGKFKNIIKDIESLSVLELAELVKALEERFGVSAAAPVAVAAGAPAGVGTPAEEEKANYTVHLVDAGAQKIAVIKAIREVRPDLGLKEAKDLVDGAPKDVKVDAPKVEAEEAKKKLEAAGAKVELK